MNDTKTQNIKWSHVGICLLALLALIFIFRQPLYNQLYSWQLVPMSQAYTELYFTSKPPQSFTSGKEQVLGFAIHNVENQATSYTYTIDQLDGNGVIISTLLKDTKLVPRNTRQTFNVPVSPIDSTSTAAVQVTITFYEKDKDKLTTQSIHYLVKRDRA